MRSRSGGWLILGVFSTIISGDAICWVGWTVIPDTHQLPLPAEPWRGHFLPRWWPGRYSGLSLQSEHQRWTALHSWTQNNGPTWKEVGRGKAASTPEDRLLSSHHTVGKIPSVQKHWKSVLQVTHGHGKQDCLCSFEVIVINCLFSFPLILHLDYISVIQRSFKKLIFERTNHLITVNVLLNVIFTNVKINIIFHTVHNPVMPKITYSILKNRTGHSMKIIVILIILISTIYHSSALT